MDTLLIMVPLDVWRDGVCPFLWYAYRNKKQVEAKSTCRWPANATGWQYGVCVQCLTCGCWHAWGAKATPILQESSADRCTLWWPRHPVPEMLVLVVGVVTETGLVWESERRVSFQIPVALSIPCLR